MRIIEGTPQEIAEYVRLKEAEEASDGGVAAEDEAAVADDAEATSSLGWPDVEHFVKNRGRGADVTNRVLDYLRGAEALGGVEMGPGLSERTKDGLSDYIMVRDAGKRRYGAVVYVKPANGGLTLRLTAEDVADLDDSYIRLRNVRPGHKYVVNCPLHDSGAVDLALKLTGRALRKVRE